MYVEVFNIRDYITVLAVIANYNARLMLTSLFLPGHETNHVLCFLGAPDKLHNSRP